MPRFSFLSRIFRFRNRRNASQKAADPETVGSPCQQHSSSSESTQTHSEGTASDPITQCYNHGVSPQTSPPLKSAIPIRVVSSATSTARPRPVSTDPVPLPLSFTPAIPSPRIVQSPLTTAFPARISQPITDPAEIHRSVHVTRTVPLLPFDRHDVHLCAHVHKDGPLAVPPSESQWVAPTQIWGEHGPRPKNPRPAANGSPQLPPAHVRRRVTFQAPPRTRVQTPPEICCPSDESLASSCSTLVPNTHFRAIPGDQAVPGLDTVVGSRASKSSTVVEITIANKELLAACDSETERKNDILLPLPSPETLPTSRIRGSEKARRYASLFTGTSQHHHNHQAERSAKANRSSLPALRTKNGSRTSFLPLPPSPGTGSGAGSTTKKEKRQSRWSREVNKPETQDMLRMMASTGLSM